MGAPTRERILAATVELVAEVGWGGVTTRLVAERAGVNNAAVNYHFTTKADLLREAAEANMEEALMGPAAAMMAAPRVLDGLVGLAEWVRDVDIRTPAMGMLLETMLQAGRDEGLRLALGGGLSMFRTLLAERIAADQAAGHFTASIDPAACAVAIAAMFDGALLHRLVDPELDVDLGPTLTTLLETP